MITEAKTLQDWQKRVVKERDELTAKLDKLTDFLATQDENLQDKAKGQLQRQHDAMTAYEAILAERIADF